MTLIGERRGFEWEGLAEKVGYVWPARSTWVYRPHSYRVSYKAAQKAATQLVNWCEDAGLTDWRDLKADVHASPEALYRATSGLGGTLESWPDDGAPGVRLMPPIIISFMDESASDPLPDLLEKWLSEPHVPAHLEKLKADMSGAEKHLFLIAAEDFLPPRYFTDDFDAPERAPRGYEFLDGLWLWSRFWHRFLLLQGGAWRWCEFPSASPSSP